MKIRLDEPMSSSVVGWPNSDLMLPDDIPLSRLVYHSRITALSGGGGQKQDMKGNMITAACDFLLSGLPVKMNARRAGLIR